MGADDTRPADDQSEAVAFLADPATHGGRPVERFNTHGAMVFLAGERAYKIKRAVRFSYMDFSTLARRRWACEREIALNRRTAPNIYLRAEAVTREADGRLVFGGTGEAVEWAVVMRRFEQADLLDRMAQDGRLSAPVLAALADAIAAFHAAAERVGAREDSGGGRAGLAWAIEESLLDMEETPELFPGAELEELAAAARSELARRADLLDRRLAHGFVRHCHGDLHLRNICLIDGAPTLFDCIEFNDKIACIDVYYDLAFLLMDLDYTGLRPWSNLVFNRYLQATGDFSGAEALALFLAARALIRAKVAASAATAQDDSQAAAAWRQEAGRYFEDARAYLAPASPRLVAVGGLSGTGKSTLARALAPDLGAAPGAVHLRSDVIRKELCGAEELERLPDSAYGPGTSRRVFATIQERAASILAGGQAVVVDAVYARPAERKALQGLAERLGVPFQGLWLTADSEALVGRVERRSRDASDATAEVVRRQLAYDTGPLDWIVLDADGPPQRVLEAARRALGL